MATATLPRPQSRIPRVNFNTINLTSERVALATAAQTKLGYSRLARAIAIPGALLFAMRSCGIEPFVQSKVETYKRSKERVGMWTGKKWGLFFLTLLALSAIGLAMQFRSNVVTPGPTTAWQVGLSALWAVLIVTGVSGACSNADRWNSGTRIKTVWRGSTLASYNGCVPEFALERALTLKAACPEADFSVHFLVREIENRDHPVTLPDPFLVVTLGNEYYYIDVWDEKEYERTL